MEEQLYDKLPLGFRFRPTDEQLLNHYLKRKINGTIQPSESWVVPEIDLCRYEPWDLPSKWPVKSSDLEWFFFAAVDRKYPSGNRSNRATKKGYWKATGKDRLIKSKKVLVGMKKTLVFHIGRAPKGIGSCWIMHEYRVVNQDGTDVVGDQGAFVLCRLFKKEKEISSPISQALLNSNLVDESSYNSTPETGHVERIENNTGVDEVWPSKPEQSHSDSDITRDFGSELRKKEEDECLFDGLKDFLGPDYELCLSDGEYPFASYMVGESSRDTDDQFALADDTPSSIRQRARFEAVDDKLKINIRRSAGSTSSPVCFTDQQQGTAERRIKLATAKWRKVKDEPPPTPPLAAAPLSHTALQKLSFPSKIGVIAVVTVMCALVIWMRLA